MDDNTEKEIALRRLGDMLPLDIILELPNIIEEVITRTGYGDARIIIVDRRVVNAKMGLSFPRKRNNR